MANPNIVGVTTILGNNSMNAVGTALVTIANNTASSGKIYKINSIVAANVDGTNAADVTLSIFDQDDLGGSAFPVVSTVSVPADASLIIMDKSTSFYLKENQSIGAVAGSSGDIVITASWEEIS